VWALDGVVLARAESAAVAVLTRLRVRGFGLSMRHSGTGPSWTSQLARVPLSDLELDGRLVSGAAADSRRLAALESAVASARGTGLRVVADGCDSQADFDTLLSVGCSEAQGRFIGDPMEAAELISWVLTGNGGGDAR
jgi:EAL domain-containing protein (putative c-di-GMP-specific phosphodiesterase class I)